MENETPATATPSNFGLDKGTHSATIIEMKDVETIIVAVSDVSKNPDVRDYDRHDIHTFTGKNKFIKAMNCIASLEDYTRLQDGDVRTVRVQCLKARGHHAWNISKFSEFAECVMFETLMCIKHYTLTAEAPVHRGWKRNETEHLMFVMDKMDNIVTTAVGFERYDYVEAKENEAKAKSLSETMSKASKYADANDLYRTEDNSI